MTVRRYSLPRMQRSQEIGRPIYHEDFHPIGVRQFAINVATRARGWAAPTETSETPLEARLDAGAWLVDCPLMCGGAELVTPQEPIFLCLSCGSGGIWWPVVFPLNLDAINTEVRKRDNVHGWAWYPGQSLTHLREETKAQKNLATQRAQAE